MIVPEGVLAFTCTISEIGALAATPSVASVQLTVPVEPTVGVVQLHAPGVMDWKVVFGGIVSVKLKVFEVAGPLLVTVCV